MKMADRPIDDATLEGPFARPGARRGCKPAFTLIGLGVAPVTSIRSFAAASC